MTFRRRATAHRPCTRCGSRSRFRTGAASVSLVRALGAELRIEGTGRAGSLSWTLRSEVTLLAPGEGGERTAPCRRMIDDRVRKGLAENDAGLG
jgi:hypothetical protein